MTEEEFSELSAKVLTNEATEEEVASHRSACEQYEIYKETFHEMETASGLLSENAPLAKNMDNKHPEIPEFLLEQLVNEVNQKKLLEEKEQRGDGLLHNDFCIGQMLGTVKVGSKLHARSVQSSGRIG